MRVSTCRAFDECWPLTADGLRVGEVTVTVYSGNSRGDRKAVHQAALSSAFTRFSY
jgi:hypothetical protein